MRWTEKQLADYQRRNGVPGKPVHVNTAAAAPFALPIEPVTLDLPPPLSVNRTRRMSWQSQGLRRQWKAVADAYVLAAKSRSENPLVCRKIKRFEVFVILSEAHNRIDLDNGIKWTVDYLRSIDVIEDDSPKHMRRLVVEWGLAPFGCRVTVRPCA